MFNNKLKNKLGGKLEVLETLTCLEALFVTFESYDHIWKFYKTTFTIIEVVGAILAVKFLSLYSAGSTLFLESISCISIFVVSLAYKCQILSLCFVVQQRKSKLLR